MKLQGVVEIRSGMRGCELKNIVPRVEGTDG